MDPGEETPPPQSLQVTPDALLLAVAETRSLEVRVDGTLRPDMPEPPVLTPESSNPLSLEVASDGTLTGLAVGEAVVRVSVGELEEEVEVVMRRPGQIVDEAGGSISLANDALRIDIPGGTTEGRIFGRAETVPVNAQLLPEGVEGTGWAVSFEDAGGPIELGGEVTVSVAFDPSTLPAGVFPETLRLHSGHGTGGSPGDAVPEESRLEGPDRVRGELAASRLGGVALAGVRPTPASDVAVGEGHACSRSADGQIFCWGSNEHGALGQDGIEESPVPLPLPGALRAVRLAAGAASSCAVDRSGELWCWGRVAEAAPGSGGGGGQVSILDFGPSVDALEVGGAHACALDSEGRLWCWGRNDVGQVGAGGSSDAEPEPIQVDQGDLQFVSMAAAESTTLAVADDGTLWSWGRTIGQPDAEASASPVHVTIKNDPPVARASVGGSTACALGGEGQVWCWGRGASGQLGRADDADASGPRPAQEADPVQFPDAAGPIVDVIVAAGGEHVCALDSGGDVWCWGRNDVAQLGVVTDARCRRGTSAVLCSKTPVRVEGLPVAERVVAAGAHACAVTIDSEIWCWGSNERGQFGVGGEAPAAGPARGATGR